MAHDRMRKMKRILATATLIFLLTQMAPAISINDNDIDACSSTAYKETLVDILKNGLPAASQPKHIVIIGAGIAGLTAAALLKNAGHKVTILEASDRVGGRILTYRDPDDKYYVDLGAMRIKRKHTFVNTYVEKFNLSTRPFIGNNDNAWIYINGQKFKVSEVEANPDILRFDTSPKEKGISGWKFYENGIQKVLDDCLDCGTLSNTCLRRYDHFSMKQYFYEVVGLSRGAMSMLETVDIWDGYLDSAFTEAMRDHDWGDFYEIDGGTDQVVQALVPELTDELVYKAKVTNIEHGNGSVVARYLSMGKHVFVSGDYLLTTATPRATALMKFSPNLDFEKQEALRTIGFMGATKIALIFQRPFWEDEGIVGGGRSITDLPSRSIYYQNRKFNSGLGLIVAYIYEPTSDIFLGFTHDECINQTLNDVAEIHGEHIRELYIEGIVKRWSLDPYSLGAFSWFEPYQLTNLWAPLARPTGNIFFAGEHTSFVHAWIDTSIKSAVEAANCISTSICFTQFFESGTNVGNRLFLNGNLFMVLLACISIIYQIKK